MNGLRRFGQHLFRGRVILVFLAAFLALAMVAGDKGDGRRDDAPHRFTKRSAENHFVHLAHGWLDGRMTLEGNPPRYKKHQHHDWARVYTIELQDGSSFRGFPCRTETCRIETKRTREETWWQLGERAWVDVPRRDIKKRDDSWYVSFPPGPAVLMLPGVAIWGMGFLDVLFTALIAALIPVVLVRMLDRVRGTEDGRWKQHLWAAVAWTVASPACFLGAQGQVWFTAQICGALFTMLYLSTAWDLRRPALAGLCLGMAMACRPHVAFAILFFCFEWWRGGKDIKALLRFALPFGLIGLALGLHNYVRFESFFEFGHRFLDMRWQARQQDYGMFNSIYLSRNLQCLFTLLPQLQPAFPYFKFSIHGMALPLTTPWLLCLLWARERFPQKLGLYLAATAVALPSLFYQNSGQLQISYRFAVDWLPMVLVALVVGGGARRWLFGSLVTVGAFIHVYTSWILGHRPGLILVLEPLGWPFQDEFM